MSGIRERLLGVTNDSSNPKSSIRDRLELNSTYYKNEYKNALTKRSQLQKNIQKSTYEKGVSTTVTPFSTQRNLLPIQEQSEITKNKKFEITAGQDKLKQNKDIENKYQEIKKSNEYKTQIKKLEEQSNKIGYAKYDYDRQRVAEDDIGWYDKSIGRFVGGIGNLFDYNGGLIKNENGDLQYLPTFNQMKNEKVQNEYKTGFGRFAGNVLYESGKIAGSTLINQVLPGVGSTAYYGKMFVDSTNQAISDGYDGSSATLYGLVNVGLEYATGKLLGSATKGLTGGKSSGYEELLNKTFSKVTKKPKIASILANAGSEATEEFVQEYLGNLTKLAILEKSANAKDYLSIFADEEILADALYSAAVGGVTGGVFGTISGKDTNVDNDRLYKTFKEELEETKKNTTNKETINKIDTIISNIDNNVNSNSNSNVDTIISQINEYETLKKQSKLTKSQESELNNLKEQLNSINNEVSNTNVATDNSNNTKNINLPSVQDIVDQEQSKSNSSNINLPPVKTDGNFNLKDAQNKIIQETNPAGDELHTWIRSADDIKTFEEALESPDYKEYYEAGEDFDETYSADMAKQALETGKITVYSSYPIEQGIFVTPSKMEAQSYSGNGKVYSKEVKLTDVAWIDPTQGQYAEVNSTILPVIDVTSINNTNQALMPADLSQIKQTKGNIPINQELLNKYSNIKEMFDNEVVNYDGKINLNMNLQELKYVDLNNIKIEDLKKLARDIFYKYNSTDTFNNDGNIIVVNNSGINESIEKIYNNRKQRNLLKEHLQVFSDLGDIIEHATLVNQTGENKNRNDIYFWNYYIDGLIMDGKKYKLEFDVRSMQDGQNQYRIQRLEIDEKKQIDYDGDILNALPPYSQSVSGNNITQSNENVKLPLPNTSNMQNNGNNTDSLIPTRKDINKINLPSVKYNNKVKMIKNITEQINKTGNVNFEERSWITTSTESDALKDKILIEDLDISKLNYEVQSNKKSLEKANKKLESMGYDRSLGYVNQLIFDEKLPSASDMALAQRVLQETVKKGDAKTAQTLLMDIAILGTDLGQATQALSIIQKLTPEGQLKLYTRIVHRAKARGEKAFSDVEITEEMVKKVLDTYNEDGTFSQEELNARVEEFKQDIAKQLKATAGDKVNAWRYLSMLGNPKTHIRNMVSNVAMKYTIKVKNAVARTLEDALPIENKTKTWKKSSNVVKQYAEDTSIEMKNIITGEAKYNEKSSLEAKKQIFKNKSLEAIRKFNSQALETEDWWFSKNAFKTTFQEYLTANGIRTQEDINNNPETIEKGKQYAVEQAEIATFRQYSKLASEISRIERNNKFAKYSIGATMPFKKTPINVAKAGLNYSPLGLIKNVSYDVYQLKKGNIETSQFIDNISQGLTGTSLSLLGLALAKAGFLIGAGDDDKDGKYDSYLGKQSYALKIGDSTYSISWLSPVAMPLLVGANAYEKLENEEEWNADIILETLAETFDPISEMSFVSSLTDVLSSYSQGSTSMIKDMGETATQSYILQFFPTLFSQLASTFDSKKRSTKVSSDSSWKFGEETLRKIMYKIPGLRNLLEESTDIWGNEKEQSSNILERSFNNFLAPWSKSKDLSTDLDSEIKKIYNSTGESGVIPGISNAYIKYKDTTYRMSADEYSNYKKTYGQKSNTYLNNLINTSAYKNATDEEKANMIESVYKYAKAEANENFFKDTDVNYTSDTLKELQELRKLDITDKSLAEYVSNKSMISSIKNNSSFETTEKKQKISNLLINSSLNDKHLAYLYGKYYSNEEILNNLVKANILIKEFIKFNSQTFESDYYDNGKTVSNSRKKKVINYINSLNLSVAQKAILIKMEYSSYNSYNSQIVNYINDMNYSKIDKAMMLKQIGFDNYDEYIIKTINNENLSIEEKTEKLKKLGFKVRNGKVYSK